MPYLSDAEIERVRSSVESNSSDADAPMPSVLPMLGGMGTTGVIGFLRAKFEDPSSGEWNVPGTRWDMEATAFLALLGLALGGQYMGLGEYRRYALVGAFGVGCHYAGEIGRRYGKTGKFDFHVGSGVPPWDPTSFDPTQFGDPNADEQARGLSSSGV